VPTNTETLRREFEVTMRAAGHPLDRVPGNTNSQLYVITSGEHAGKTIRLRTNRQWVLQARADGVTSEAHIPYFENVDFVGAACGREDRRGRPEGAPEHYLIPAARVREAMRDIPSVARVLFFANRRGRFGNLDYARKFAEFRVGVVAGDPAQPPPVSANEELADQFRIIADKFGVPISSVHITVEMLPGRLVAHLEAPAQP
jgi:hypothetical protein